MQQSYPQHLVSQHLTDFDLDTITNWLEIKDFKNLFKLADTISSLEFHNSWYSTQLQLYILYLLLEAVPVLNSTVYVYCYPEKGIK